MTIKRGANAVRASSGSRNGDAEGDESGGRSHGDGSSQRSVSGEHPAHDDGAEVVALVDHVVSGLHRQHSEVIAPPEPEPTASETTRLAELSVARDLAGATALVQTALEQGRSAGWIGQHLVAAAARQLGEAWTDDRLSFAEVTVGAGVLQHLVRGLTPPRADGSLKAAELILLTSGPHEQHTLGLYVLAHALEEVGWSVHLQPRLSARAIGSLVDTEEPVAVGIAISDERGTGLGAIIKAIRSRPSPPSVILGGPVHLDALAMHHGVSRAYDAADAVALVHELVA